MSGVKLTMFGIFTGTKSVALIAVPIEETTVILPVTAVAGTRAIICVEDGTVKRQKLVSINTSVTPMKLVPVIVTVFPTSTHPGENPLMEMGAITV